LASEANGTTLSAIGIGGYFARRALPLVRSISMA
jgi:hypothetical protein